MTTWYRAAQTEEVRTVFSGDGGLYVAGRWNPVGRKAIYCSESISLCTLEWLSHHGLLVSGFSYYRFSIEVPDALIVRPVIEALPQEWNETPATDKTRDFAENILLKETQYLAMAVPSVVIPEELNLIINPLHVAFSVALKTVRALGQYTVPYRVI
ncbi:MAG: RES family NAD+ phosphorylase [Gammaproteobacteria bacterium]|nr:RES family NAD+ phosphorylase [Gammaproteobacteria bacterium]